MNEGHRARALWLFYILAAWRWRTTR